MVLFMNEGDHPDIFKNDGIIEADNQEKMEIDYFSELLKAQMRSNEEMHASFGELKRLMARIDRVQVKEAGSLQKQLSQLQKGQEKIETIEADLISRLKSLETGEKEIHDKLHSHAIATLRTDKEIISKLKRLEKTYSQFAGQEQEIRRAQEATEEKLALIEEAGKEALAEIRRVGASQEKLTEKFDHGEKERESIAGRLENQEALTEKILRQLQHLRSIIFERSSDLAEKIENGAALTATSMQRLFSMNQPQLLLTRSPDDVAKGSAENSAHDRQRE